MARYGLGRCIRSHLARTTGCASSRPLRSTSFGTGPWPTTAVRRMFWTARYSRCRLLAVADPAALQAAADRLSPDIVRRRLDYWTLILGPKFSKKETTFDLSEKTYGLNQLRHDLRKLKGHGLIERDGFTLRLPPHAKRHPGGPALPVLPQAPLRAARQQPLPSPARPAAPSQQPARSRLSPCRYRHPTRR